MIIKRFDYVRGKFPLRRNPRTGPVWPEPPSEWDRVPSAPEEETLDEIVGIED